MILGGVFLTACQKEIELSLLSPQEVVIYTNDEQAENYQSKQIEVELKNSSAGIEVELSKGEGRISFDVPVKKGGDRYAFTVYGVSSGEAEIKIYAKDDLSVFKTVKVVVHTLLEELKSKTEDIGEEGSNYFAVKGVGKNLNVLDYFSFEPVTADMNEVKWSFNEFDDVNRVYKTVLTNALGDEVAKIQNGILTVSENYTGSTIRVRASFVRNEGINGTVDFKVLENSTIDTLVISNEDDGEKTFYSEGGKTSNQEIFELKRNDSDRSKATGNLIVNSIYDMNLDLIVYQKQKDGTLVYLPNSANQEDVSDGEVYSNEYFSFTVLTAAQNAAGTKMEYTFEIDAIDENLKSKKSGEFYVYLQIKYADYAYSITTGSVEDAFKTEKSGVDIVVDETYTATRLELINENQDGLNNSIIDVFSSYEESDGYKIQTLITPDEFEIDNKNFYISIDLNQEALRDVVGELDRDDPIDSVAKFYYQGTKLVFEEDASSPGVYYAPASHTKSLQSKAIVEVVSAGQFDTLNNVEFAFVSESNPMVARTTVNMNFYCVSAGEMLEITKFISEDDNERAIVKTYLSSAASSQRQIEYRVKFNGLTTLNGMTLKHDENSNFDFSSELQDVTPLTAGAYVVGAFTVTLNNTNFSDTVSFWFEHVTGKRSSKYEIEAYVPLSGVSIQNGDKSSADVFVDEMSTQKYIIDASERAHLGDVENVTLSRLMLEAGVNLPLNINYSNATLNGVGIEFKYMSEQILLEAIKTMEGITDEAELKAKADYYLTTGTLPAQNYYYTAYFNPIADAPFTIDKNGIYLNNNNTFRGYVAVIVRGFEETIIDEVVNFETRANINILRVFSIESFFSVRYMSSNIRATELYTTQTLSADEYNRAIVDVKIALRPDENVPTYSNELSYFKFKSANTLEGAGADGYFVPSIANSTTQNQYYQIANITTVVSETEEEKNEGKENDGKYLQFRIIAHSTNMQTSVNDILTIVYEDENGNTRETDIQIRIKNVNRVESVQWTNQTQDGEIYLNLTTTIESERNFTISTSVLPSHANNIGLRHYYVSKKGNPADLMIKTSTTGQTFNLNINTTTGGYGYLYLLPSDMIKIVDGIEQVLYYDYQEDADGSVINEVAYYVPLAQLENIYDDLLNGSENVSNYFLNNDGEKIYYRDLLIRIKVTIADGKSEDAAIRLYNSADFNELDYAKYYKVMNNIALDGWETNIDRVFSGMIFGKDDSVTLSFGTKVGTVTQPLFNVVSGTIKDLTFTGRVSDSGLTMPYVGFVANKVESTGVVENVTVDVYYDSTTSTYVPSSLSSSINGSTSTDVNIFVGGVVGYNEGTLKKVFNNGVNITQTGVHGPNGVVYVGGIAGFNSGTISESGVEFYDYVNASGETYSNKIVANSSVTNYVGGHVGYSSTNAARIEKSYVYAYPLENGDSFADILSGTNVSAFIGRYKDNPTIEQSFAYLGDLEVPVISVDTNTKATFKDSYITYYQAGVAKVYLFKNAQLAYGNSGYVELNAADLYHVLSESDKPTAGDPNGSAAWEEIVNNISDSALGELWAYKDGEIDSEVNLGFMHLKGTTQKIPANVSEVALRKVEDSISNLKALPVEGDKAILFAYTPTASIVNSAEISALTSLNTIRISDLLNVSEQQADSLLITSDSKDLTISSGSIRILRRSTEMHVLKVHSKMDMSQSKEFGFVILNQVPQIQTTINSNVVKDGQIVLVQSGLNNSRSLNYSTNNVVALNGNIYATEKETFDITFALQNNTKPAAVGGGEVNCLSVSKSNGALVLTGNYAKDTYVTVNSAIKLDSLVGLENEEYFHEAIAEERNRTFYVSIFEGATSISVENANSLVVKPNEYAEFDVTIISDNTNENLVLSMTFDDVELANVSQLENEAEFAVDSKLVLQVSWTKTIDQNDAKISYYKVLVKIKSENKHLITHEYDGLTISVSPASQNANATFVKTVSLAVKTQEIDDFSITTYSVENRQIRSSVLYFTPSKTILNSLSPASDAIVAVTVSPESALMSHFTLTYEATGTSVGVVTISKLGKNGYGYYLDSSSTSYVQNGIRVDLTEADRTGDGVFYFRIYISSQFQANSDLKLRTTFYYESQQLTTGTHNLKVDYMSEANVKVNGSSTVLLAKGSTATVTIRTGKDQSLYNLYLQNSKTNISLSDAVAVEYDNYILWTASLSAGIDATLTSGDSGIFYVCAQVQRIKNNVQEIKSSQATVCLVDFAIDADKTTLHSSGATTTYNGKTYDVFYSYLNSPDILRFDYKFNPEEYSYNPNDTAKLNAVQQLLEMRDEFEQEYKYGDDSSGYYINHKYNEFTGYYQALSLKQQLWYATDEENGWKVYNDAQDVMLTNDYFSIDRITDGGREQLQITGKRIGKQLMKLQTTVHYNGIEFVYDYYFVVAVEVWSDEETPTQITTAEEFVSYIKDSEEADDYILMNDIVLNDYEPLNTDKVDSLDGNGYTIHINSFKQPDENTTLNLALFDTVYENTTLKNVKVNIYNGGQIYVNYKKYNTVNIAGFALTNNGVIYNCEVLSYYDENNSLSYLTSDAGLVVKFTEGNNTTPINLAPSMNVESKISGFVITNNSSIVNSRVGGEEFMHIVKIAGKDYVKEEHTNMFVLEGQGEVSGFVNTNASEGNISACYVDNVQIYNKMTLDSLTAGFVVYNENVIQASYVEGVESFEEDPQGGLSRLPNNEGSSISAQGVIAGFVYQNTNLIKNSYANIAIENSSSKATMSAGFVYTNTSSATITLCYSACTITKNDINQMQFSGVDESIQSLNYGEISFSYFYNRSRIDDTNQNTLTSGILSVTDVDDKDTFYGFSFASSDSAYDGIWTFDNEVLTLVSANKIAFSNRYAVTTNNVTSILYNKTILNADTMKYADLSYGSQNNPIIIRNEVDFAMATGKATDVEYSSYKEYYSDTTVFGNYRVVDDIDMANIDQNAETAGVVKLTTTGKTFTGLLDGNGFTIENINLGSHDETLENFGLFAKLDGAVVMNLNLIVDSVHNDRANIVGTLAGTATDSTILAIKLTPVSTETSIEQTSIQGKNVVGGVVGILLGESRLNDVKVESIDVYSSSYDNSKDIGSNDSFTGKNLRGRVEKNAPLKSYVEHISYAGAIVGYVDIYNAAVQDDYAKFSSTLEMSDYDVVTAYATDFVDIYAEVAGGLFGYVGNSTLIYDAKIELDADMNRSNPSYIISKNLYAGGLVGENYGGLFAVSAKYSDAVQDLIDGAGETSNQNAYYNGSTAVEKGQQTIFSYTPEDADFGSKHNAPKYIGGLVGYMGGGYIYTGYNKLNVIAHSQDTEENANGELDTVAVGGIIGLAKADTEVDYNLTTISNAPKVNIYLNEVYSAGDLYALTKDAVKESKGFAGGIIGKITGDTRLAMKYVMSLNYYSYEGETLLGDYEGRCKHYALIAGYISAGAGDENGKIYVLDSDRGYYEYYSSDASTRGALGAVSVGGYRTVKDTTMHVLGFDNNSGGLYEDDQFLDVLHVGDASNQILDAAYAKFSNYFLPLGWSDEFWTHTEGLYPEIVLMPVLNVVYWDNDNNLEVLEQIVEDSNATVIVRGKTTAENGEISYQDIDLTEAAAKNILYGAGREGITNFSGRLVSYHGFMNSTYEGVVTKELDSGKGGQIGADVGLVVNDTLFDSIDSAKIENLNIYMNANPNGDSYNLAVGLTENALFREVNFMLNDNVVMTGESREVSVTIGGTTEKRQSSISGLLTNYASATSFVDINIVSRKFGQHDPDGYSTITLNANEDANIVDAYFGVLAGYIELTSGFSQIAIQGLTFQQEYIPDGDERDESQTPFEANYNYSPLTTIYAGLYAGRIAKGVGNKADISVGINEIDNLKLTLAEISRAVTPATATETILNVGSFAGELNSVNTLTLSATTIPDPEGVDIILNNSVDKLYAGGAFALVSGGSQLTMGSPQTGTTTLKTAIYQTEGTSAGSAIMGGLVAQTNTSIDISGLKADFTVGKYVVSAGPEPENIYEQNLYDYTDKLNPFVVKATGDDSVGGFVGYAMTGASVSISGTCEIAGQIELKTENDRSAAGYLSVGGAVGKTTDSVTIGGQISNSMNISVADQNADETKEVQTYVGGLIGYAQKVNGTGAPKYTITVGSTREIMIDGIVLASVENLYYGGAIGYTDRVDCADAERKITIEKVVFGGTVKIYDSPEAVLSGAEINVGGIVGGFELTGATIPAAYEYIINDCDSYGDVFVIYNPSTTTRLNAYNFGGIVGVGAQIKVKNCNTIMTSFNNRINAGDDLNINAVVGKNASTVSFENNNYSSGVSLAYQEEAGNFDIAYTSEANNNYNGYSTKFGRADANGSHTRAGYILSSLSGYASTEDQVGHKLKPYSLNDTSLSTDEIDLSDISGSFNNIKWISVDDNLVGSSKKTVSLASNFSNAVLVGNGKTISRTDSQTVDLTATTSYGGIVNELGTKYDSSAIYDPLSSDVPLNTVANFSAISSLVVDLDVSADFNNTASNYAQYGGVAGAVYGNSIIYAVGARGELSVGGASNALRIGGIAGWVEGGLISNSYVDAHMSYRAGEGGYYSGIANFNKEKVSHLRESYSAGILESYVGLTAHALAYVHVDVGDPAISENNTIIDCYSYSQSKYNDVASGTWSIDLTNGKFKTYNQVLNGVYGSQGTIEEIGTMALGYAHGSKAHKSIKASADAGATDTHSTWYFNQWINNGYATHGFGFLKPVTAYTRTISSTTDSGSTEYQYAPVDYASALAGAWTEGWYLGVPNVGKFEQMQTESSADGWTEGCPFNYVLIYDIDVESITETAKRTTSMTGEGDYRFTFELDGNNKTLDNVKVTLFDHIEGDVYNLRMTNIAVNGAGVLSNRFDGNLTNITAIGNLTANSTTAGGIVCAMGGTITDVDSLVNVSTTQTGAIVGGIVGSWWGNNISYSTNAGQIIATGANSTAAGLVGGIYAATIIRDSYNAGAVLAGYTSSTSSNYNAGGILGDIASGVTSVTVSNCYNTGMIGAGNYSSLGVAHAGGIAGNGTIKAQNCINDGPVEALSNMDDINGTVSVNKINGQAIAGKNDTEISQIADQTATSTPGNLTVEVVLTYDEKPKRVYAYGIANDFEAGSEGNKTSVDNIKNDGWIKPNNQISEIVFNRSTMFNNVYQDNSLKGTFDFDEKSIYSNGYDAYGYAVRVYMKDVMTRRYTRFESGWNLDRTNILSGASAPAGLYFGYAENGSSAQNKLYWDEDDKNDPYGGPIVTSHNYYQKSWGDNEKAYQFVGSTNYYAYTTFTAYQDMLETSNNPLVAGKVEAIGTLDLSSKINEIDDKKANSEATITNFKVNGNMVALVVDKTTMKTAFTPYNFTIETTIDAGIEGLTKDNFGFSLSQGGSPINATFSEYTIAPNADPTKYDISITCYFSEEKTNVSVSMWMEYDVSNTITLQKNNVLKVGSEYKIYTECEFDDFKDTVVGGYGSKVEKVRFINGIYDKEFDVLRVDDNAGKACIIIDAADVSATDANNFDGASVNFEYTKTEKISDTEYISTNVLTETQKSGEQAITASQAAATFGYLTEDLALSWQTVQGDIYALQADISDLLEREYYSLHICSNDWNDKVEISEDGSIIEQHGDSGIKVSLDGTNIVVSKVDENGNLLQDANYYAELNAFVVNNFVKVGITAEEGSTSKSEVAKTFSWQSLYGPDKHQLDLDALYSEIQTALNIATTDRFALKNDNFELAYNGSDWGELTVASADISLSGGILTLNSASVSGYENVTIYYDNKTGVFNTNPSSMTQAVTNVYELNFETVDEAGDNFTYTTTNVGGAAGILHEAVYTGNNLSAEVGFVSAASVGGLNFGNVVFEYKNNVTLIVKEYVEIIVEGSGGKEHRVNQLQGNSTHPLTFSPTKITYNRIDYELTGESFTGEELTVGSYTLVSDTELSLIDETNVVEYSVVETYDDYCYFDIDGTLRALIESSALESDSVCTTKTINGQRVYSYTIYENGIVEVEYYIWKESGGDIVVDSDSKKFVFDTTNRVCKILNYVEAEGDFGCGQGATFKRDSDASGTYIDGTGVDATYEYLDEYNGIVVDLLGGRIYKTDNFGATKSNFTLLRNNYADKANLKLEVTTAEDQNYSVAQGSVSSVIFGKQESYARPANPNFKSGSFKVNGELKSDAFVITADNSMIAKDYVVSWTNIHKSADDPFTESAVGGADSIQVDTILLRDDVFLGSYVFGENPCNIVAANYSVRFAAAGKSLFEKNEKAISHLALIGQVSARTSFANIFTTTNSGSVSNLLVYGGIRNVSSTLTGTCKIVSDTVSEGSITDSVSTSFMRGLDAPASAVGVNGAAVAVTLSVDTCLTSKDVIVAGNGRDGKNGSDGTRVVSETSRSGTNGGNGGNGGAISNATGAHATGYYRVGIQGYAGYGGNGADGWYDKDASEKKTYGGGAGAMPGTGRTSAVAGRKFSTQKSGNGGVGSVGVMKLSVSGDGYTVTDYAYASSSGGGLKGVDCSDATKVSAGCGQNGTVLATTCMAGTLNSSHKSKGTIALFGITGTLAQNTSHYGPYYTDDNDRDYNDNYDPAGTNSDWVQYSSYYNHWFVFGEDKLDGIELGYPITFKHWAHQITNLLGAYDKSSSGTERPAASAIYMKIELDVDCESFKKTSTMENLWGYTYRAYECKETGYRKVVWTSGESFNSAGNANGDISGEKL